MGKTEERVTKAVKRARIQNILLLSLYTAGTVTLMMAAPNTMRILKYADPLFNKKLNPARRMSQAVSRLQSRGLVHRLPNRKLELTTKGKSAAGRIYMLESVPEIKKRKWDGRWRLVMFDIWERRKQIRNRLREFLQKKGFIRLQNSVWIYPYDCEDLIAFIRTDLKLGRGLQYFVADGAEYDSELKKTFELD